jgi:hypothetical protein
MALNDAVDWRADLGGGTKVALNPGRHLPLGRGDPVGPVPWVLWGGLVADEVDDKRRSCRR